MERLAPLILLATALSAFAPIENAAAEQTVEEVREAINPVINGFEAGQVFIDPDATVRFFLDGGTEGLVHDLQFTELRVSARTLPGAIPNLTLSGFASVGYHGRNGAFARGLFTANIGDGRVRFALGHNSMHSYHLGKPPHITNPDGSEKRIILDMPTHPGPPTFSPFASSEIGLGNKKDPDAATLLVGIRGTEEDATLITRLQIKPKDTLIAIQAHVRGTENEGGTQWYVQAYNKTVTKGPQIRWELLSDFAVTNYDQEALERLFIGGSIVNIWSFNTGHTRLNPYIRGSLGISNIGGEATEKLIEVHPGIMVQPAHKVIPGVQFTLEGKLHFDPSDGEIQEGGLILVGQAKF